MVYGVGHTYHQKMTHLPLNVLSSYLIVICEERREKKIKKMFPDAYQNFNYETTNTLKTSRCIKSNDTKKYHK